MDKKDFFQGAFWAEAIDRLKTLIPSTKLDEFAVNQGLTGFRLDRVMNKKKGVNIETLVRICQTLDVSPSWWLFGKGRPALSQIRDKAHADIWEKTSKRLKRCVAALPERKQKEILEILEELQANGENSRSADLSETSLDTGRTKGRGPKTD